MAGKDTQMAASTTSNSDSTRLPEAPIQNNEAGGFFSSIAVLSWLGVFHLNAIVALLVLFNLRSTWAQAIIPFYVLLAFLPAEFNDPWGVWIAKFIAKYATKHFPMVLHFEDESTLTPNRAFVFALEPHSVMPIGMLSLCSYAGLLSFPKVRALGSSAVFRLPFMRHIWTWLGVVPASREVFTKLLNVGYSCILNPGGVQEILYMEPGHEVVFLKQRYGFVRVAIETGAPLVPVFCFGQTDIYHWWKPRGKFYSRVSRALKFTPMIFWGIYGSPIPYRRPLYIAVGRPIEVTKNLHPSRDEVAAVLSKFIQAIEDLYDKHKLAAGFEDTLLRVY